MAFFRGTTLNLMGRVGKEPELGFWATKKDPSKGLAYLKFSLAVDKSHRGTDGAWIDKTEWVNCTVKGPQAEKLAEIVHKGNAVSVIAYEFEVRTWIDKDSNDPRAALSIDVEGVKILTPKTNGSTKPSEDETAEEDDIA